MPWKKLVAVIEPHYPKGERDRRPFPLETILRIHFMQQWFGLSDPGMEDELHDNVSSRVFAGLPVGVAPDETTICKFRHLLEKHKLAEQLFATSQKHLVQRGLMVKSGTIVDATIISASTKNKDRQRDPEMKSTHKGNQWYFGMKAHIGTDTEGRVHCSARLRSRQRSGSTRPSSRVWPISDFGAVRWCGRRVRRTSRSW